MAGKFDPAAPDPSMHLFCLTSQLYEGDDTHANGNDGGGAGPGGTPGGAGFNGIGGNGRGADSRAPLLLADALIGNIVINLGGESVGDIKGVMLDVHKGRIAYAVLGIGGFFGVEREKLFAVPWGALTFDARNERFLLDIDKERFARAPYLDMEGWSNLSDTQWVVDVHRFYHANPYWE